jgi:hypothetical protein
MRTLLKILLWPLKWLLALVILFEEWGWEPLQRLMERWSRALGLTGLAAWVQRLPPYAALALFALPALALLPIKLLALWLIAQGRALLGALVIIVAKLVGTAILARLFALTKPALMQLAWFARLHDRWVAWKEALLAWARASSAWQQARAWRLAWRARWQRWRAAADRG